MVKILTSLNLNHIGGQEQWVNDIIDATKDNPKDVQTITDDKALWKADLDKPHLYYLTTPRRSLYDMNYAAEWIHKPIIPFVRVADQYKIKQVKNIACISKTVADRIKKYYNRDATVIYPCVRCEDYISDISHGCWLSVQRIDKWKRVEMQVEAFRHMPDEKLIIVGPMYPQYEYLWDEAPDNVYFWGLANKKELKRLYSECKGVICTSINEDFGLVPLEAMASGKPVVAVNEGGYRETVVDGVTGRLVNDIREGILHCPQNPELCMEQAKKFDYEIFKERLNKILEGIDE